MYRVLVVDDEADLRMTVSSALREENFQVDVAVDGDEAVNKVQSGDFHLVLLDVSMPKMSGLEALKEIKAHDPSIVVIMLTAFANIRDAVNAVKEGAFNYLEKPIRADNLVALIQRALKAKNLVQNVSLSAPVIRLPGGTEFIGQSSEMKKIFGVIDKLAGVDTAVLIRGESGTGKELVAQALHFNGPRKDFKFVSVNCSAIPENLIESEFFGHERGAFTGADTRKIGKFQFAENGTLFLDEIGDISPGMQVKLLRVLQEKRFTPVGSNREIEVNVRIVAATNRNLEKMIREEKFREDLFYRLNVLPIYLPALRERRKDIDVLARHFIEKLNLVHGKAIAGMAPECLEALRIYSWPGNIRQLENVIEHAYVLESTKQITLENIPETVREAIKSASSLQLVTDGATGLPGGTSETPGFKIDVEKMDFQASKEQFERQFLIAALKNFSGRINQTALHANIPKKTLLRKLEKYGIDAKAYKVSKDI